MERKQIKNEEPVGIIGEYRNNAFRIGLLARYSNKLIMPKKKAKKKRKANGQSVPTQG